MTFIIFTTDSQHSGYFWGLDSLDKGCSAGDLSRIFYAENFNAGIDHWPTFFQSCIINAKHTNLSSPDDVKLLYPELFI